MKRATPGTKSKKAAPARKPAPTRVRARAKTKTVKVKKVSAQKSKPRPVAKRKKVASPAKSLFEKSGVRTRPSSGTAVTKKPRAKPNAARKLKAAAKVPAKKSPRKTAGRKHVRTPKLTLPDFLLEGDEPSFLTEAGAAEKFALGPSAPPDHFDEGNAPLPASYGTGKLFLTARDPHWLYAHWDFAHEEQFRHNARSMDRHLILRLHDDAQPEKHIGEIHVHPESKHWFVHVDAAGAKYFTELGYYQTGRRWKSLATSAPMRTPPDNISTDSTVQFTTIPLELSFETMLALLKEHSGDGDGQNLPLARAIENIRTLTRHDFPEAMHIADWTPDQEQALTAILVTDRAALARPSSQDSAGEAINVVNPIEAVRTELPSSHVSSFFGGEVEKRFWFNVNAELIIYGATDPNASVSLAGKQIPLRPDGSFRFQFALPDGKFAMPVVAVSADGNDGRAAELKFTRATDVHGHVGAHPHNPELNPPPRGND